MGHTTHSSYDDLCSKSSSEKIDTSVVSLDAERARRNNDRAWADQLEPSSHWWDKYLFRDHIDREWLHALEGDEFKLLSVIRDALYGWKHSDGRVTITRLSRGDPSGKKGHGTGTSESATRRTLHKLIKRGIIRVHGAPTIRGQHLSINTSWMPAQETSATCDYRRRIKLMPTQEDDPPPRFEHHLPPCVSASTPLAFTPPQPLAATPSLLTEKDNLEIQPRIVAASAASQPAADRSVSDEVIVPRRRERPASCPAPSSVTSATLPAVSSPPPVPAPPLPAPLKPIAPPAFGAPDLFEPLKPLNERRAAGVFAGRKNPEIERQARRQLAKPGAVEKTFRETFAEIHGDVPGAQCPKWSKLTLSQMKNFCEKWRGSAENLHDFVDWMVRHWSELRQTLFGWMGKKGDPAPDFPTPKFLVSDKLSAILIPAWGSYSSRTWIDRLDDNRRRLYESLTRKQGKTHEEAVLVMADVRAESNLREEMAKAKAEASRMQRAAQLALQRAEQVGMYGKHNPHPTSPAGLKARAAAAIAKVTPENLQPGSNVLEDVLAFVPEPYREK